jgi:periplasmic protein TonB
MTQHKDWQLGDPLDRSDTFAGASGAPNGAASGHTSGSPARRAKREMRIAVSLSVEIRDQFGGREQARTQFVMVRGAVLTTSSQLRVGHKLTLHNLKNGKNAECHVIATEPNLKNAHQVEVEFTGAQHDFWPVQFPHEDSRLQEDSEFVTEPQEKHFLHSRTSFQQSSSLGSAAKSHTQGSNLSPTTHTNVHDGQIVVLGDSVAQDFSPSPRAQAPERFTPRVAPVDSVAQFRAANRAAHKRDQRRKALYSAGCIAALAAFLVFARPWVQHRPEDVEASSVPAVVPMVQSLTAKAQRAISTATAKISNQNSPVASSSPTPYADAPSIVGVKPISGDAKPDASEELTADIGESTPVETQISVQHKASLASSRKTASTDADEAPIALPLQVGQPANLQEKPEALSQVVAAVSPRAAILAPQPPRRVVPAKLMHSVPAQYPSMARQLHVEGEVVVSLDVDASGSVSAARAVSGAPLLRAAALDAVRRWKYQPATLGEKPIPSTETVKLDFRSK